ncbi:MAG TPA: HXXEE domain-containing protein, partial [Candidatus Udaeobacter sp.]
MRNNLYLMTALAVVVAVFIALNWASIPILQRMTGLFFVGLVAHLWEEQRIPGGFVEMVTEHLHFTASSREFGEVCTAACVLVIAFVPFLLPQVAFLAMAPMMLGVLEAVEHVGVIKVFRLKRFYSPGMITAVCVLLPISVFSIA